MKITKRNGKLVDFNKGKIINAINAAMIEVDGELFETDTAYNIATDIEEAIEAAAPIKVDVETIQNWVEEELMKSERKDVARAYIRYRYKKEVARNYTDDFMKAVSEKLQAKNVENQNANVDEHSFGGRIGEASRLLMKKYALENCVSDMARRNHEGNMVYIHDLDSYAVGMHNCLTIPFDDLLAKGFNTRQTDVRPANSVNTAFQLIAVIFQLQSLQQFGGVSASHIDWTMVPYVRKSFYKHYQDGLKYIERFNDFELTTWWAFPYSDIENISIEDKESYEWEKAYQYAMDMTIKEVHQAVEGMYHNLNTLQSRSGNQLPFTSINYGTCTLPEGRMITKALLEVSIEGIGALHKTSIFPCGIFQCMKDVNREPGDPNYDLFKLAIRSTAQRLYPNYVNVDWSVNAGYDKNDPRTYVSTMGCRTYNGADINAEPGQNPQSKDGRGNIAPVTIIMPTLAMMAKEISGDAVDNFFNLLDIKIHEAKDMLVERYKYICSQSSESAKFMYENNVIMGYKPEEGIESAIKHGTLVIGQLGLAETLQILLECDHTEKKGMDLAKRIEQLFKERCAEFKNTLKLNFGVYYTPAENLCYTAMKKFQNKYGIIENVSDREYFTNSMHVPVWKPMSPFDKIDIEAELTGYSSGGCITYVELDSAVKNNLDALEVLINYAMDKDIPYFALNVPNDMCTECGYTDELNDDCPQCGSHDIRRLRRVTGYLTGDYNSAFNAGKIAEANDRYKHSNNLPNWNK